MNIPLEMQVNKTQAGLYTVTYGCKEAPLGVQELAFAANSLGMVSPAQLGFLRAQEGRGTFEPYSKTNADVFYDDRSKLAVIVPNGVISRIVGLDDLVDVYGLDGEFIILKNQRDLVYDVVDEMLRKGTAFTANRGRTDVNTSEFGQTELTSKLFSDEGLGITAQDYGYTWIECTFIKLHTGIGCVSLVLAAASEFMATTTGSSASTAMALSECALTKIKHEKRTLSAH